MKVNHVRQTVLPLLAAFIWGVAFVAQSVGAGYVGSFTFNASRALLGFAFLFVLCVIQRRLNRSLRETPVLTKDTVWGGISCGTALTVSCYLQQKGIETTSSGKAGFITALYIVLVPIAGIFIGKRATKTVWLGVALAVGGLYCLCVTERFTIAAGDIYLLLCAAGFTLQIMAVDHYGQKVNGVELSCAQFLVMFLLSTMGMLLTETVSLQALANCAVPILYTGILSSGVGYTLQILAQKDSDPTVVSLLLSMEALFATLAGAVILHDRMSGREYLGCALMLAAVIFAQIPEKQKKYG